MNKGQSAVDEHTENIVAVVVSAAQVRMLFWTAHLPLLDVRVKPDPLLVVSVKIIILTGKSFTNRWSSQ